MNNKVSTSTFWGAAFLMATSAIGPGFLTQTALFTEKLGASFGFVILFSILLDIGVQLNIWRIITGCGLPAQDIANRVVPGLGWLLAVLVFLGGIAFNIGNIAGAALGLEVITGMDIRLAVLLCAAFAIWLLVAPNAAKLMDRTVVWMGIAMLLFTLYVTAVSRPPMGEALQRSFWPETMNWTALITIVGGTVGGYICFAGAHRLLAAGIQGPATVPQVNNAAIKGILTASTMRLLLFLAALGVVSKGVSLSSANPAADVFRQAAGELGYRFFGIVMWLAAITSVIGSAYTSISFVKTASPVLAKNEKAILVSFIGVSTIVFLLAGQPVRLLVLAGTINGFILPLALGILLFAVSNKKVPNDYRHPRWLGFAGWLIAAALCWMAVLAIAR